MESQWEELVGERRPEESGYLGRGGSGQPGPDCEGLEVGMRRGGWVRLSYNPNDRQLFGLVASTKTQ